MAYDVLLKTTEMGTGDKALTENLMNAFIHTVAQRKEKPQNVIMYGTGVKLAAKGSEVIEDLQTLVDAGVKVLSCGICVDYYELSKKIVVGGITTMDEVVDILANSQNIVTP